MKKIHKDEKYICISTPPSPEKFFGGPYRQPLSEELSEIEFVDSYSNQEYSIVDKSTLNDWPRLQATSSEIKNQDYLNSLISSVAASTMIKKESLTEFTKRMIKAGRHI
tara:strand:- start:1751 stop:2077 length:327 start_codon:yes stop_codon:yes gene_type:complete